MTAEISSMRPTRSSSPYHHHHHPKTVPPSSSIVGQLDEVICAAIHLLPDAHSSLVAVSTNKKSSRHEWEHQLWRSVEILLLPSRDRTYQLPLIGIPAQEEKMKHILVNLGKIIGIDTADSKVIFLNLDTSTTGSSAMKYANRRIVAVVIINVRGHLSANNGDPACNPMLKSLNHIAAMPLGRQSAAVVDAVINWLSQECTNSEQLFNLFHQPRAFTPVRSADIHNNERRVQTYMGGSVDHLIPASQSDQSLHYKLHYAQQSLFTDSRTMMTSSVDATAGNSPRSHSRNKSGSPALLTRGDAPAKIESDYGTPPRLGGLPKFLLSELIGHHAEYGVNRVERNNKRPSNVIPSHKLSSPKFISSQHLNTPQKSSQTKLSKSAESLLPSKKLTEYLGTTPVYTTYSRTQQKNLENADYPRDPSYHGNPLINLRVDTECDTLITNPLKTATFNFTWKVDIIVKNPMSTRRQARYQQKKYKEGIAIYAQNWSEDFPLHSAAVLNDSFTVASLIAQGHLAGQRDRIGWSAVHYAAWYGHLKVLSTLLSECGVNLLTHPHERTPLHLAAMQGHTNVVALLLSHLDIKIEICDSFGKMAVDYCTETSYHTDQYQRCRDLIQGCVDRQSSKLIVHFMDESSEHVVLTRGDHTAVKQIHHQLMTNLDLPESCIKVFALWITSKGFQYQLNEDDKVVEQLANWKTVTVPNFTDNVDASKEQPQLVWKRDARLTVEEEKQIKHIPTLALLFREALSNYMKSCYPCTTQDVIFLGSLLLHIFTPKPFASAAYSANSLTLEPSPLNSSFESDIKQVKQFLSNDKCLSTVIPKSFKVKGSNWPYLLLKRFKEHGLVYAKKSKEELECRFLSLCWNLTIYGSAFFSATMVMKGYKNPVAVIVGVNDFGVHVVHEQKKHLVHSFSYKDISWLMDNSIPALRIHRKASEKPMAVLRSKQSQLMSQLMYRMAPLSTAN